MLKLLPLLAVATAGLVFWFVVAFMSDNDTTWTTSEPVQILTALGGLAGAITMLAIVALTARRATRRGRSTR
jgi:nitrate reductase gamma subunit